MKKEFLKYFIIGSSAAVLDIVTLYLLKNSLEIRPYIAVIFNQVLIINYVFFLNKYWTFSSRDTAGKQMARFYFLTVFNFLFSVTWMFVMNENLGVNYLLARTSNIAMAVSWNFLLYKYWIFTVPKIEIA